MQNDLGSLPSRSTGFARSGCPVGAAGPKVGVLHSERTVPKGPKASRQKQNGVTMTRFLTNLFELAKVSRIVMSGGFRCGAMFRKGDRFSDPPHFLPSSVMVCLRRKPRKYDRKRFFFKNALFCHTKPQNIVLVPWLLWRLI